MLTPSQIFKLPRIGCRYLMGDDIIRHQVHYVVFPKFYKLMFKALPRLTRGERKIFIDLGANVGGGFRFFSTVFSPADYTYHFFEPNPHCVAQLEKNLEGKAFPRGKKIFAKAAWVRDEPLKFYGIAETDNLLTEGGSVISNHNTAYYDVLPEKALQVEGMDLAAYLRGVMAEFDLVVIKMDIEGSELDVLEYLWQQPELFIRKTILFTEFHSDPLTGVTTGMAI